jgi:hypothetical protein
MANEMNDADFVTHQQKYGIIVYVPKRPHPTKVEDYRPLTLLNTDYKLVTRIIANRLRLWVKDLFQNYQYCGVTDTSIFEAVATIRDAVAYA